MPLAKQSGSGQAWQREVIRPHDDFCCHRITCFNSSNSKSPKFISQRIHTFTQQWFSESFLTRQLQGAGSGKQNGWLGYPVPWLPVALHSTGPTAFRLPRSPPAASTMLPKSKWGESQSTAEVLPGRSGASPICPRDTPDTSPGGTGLDRGPGAKRKLSPDPARRKWCTVETGNRDHVLPAVGEQSFLQPSRPPNSVKQNCKNGTFFRTIL